MSNWAVAVPACSDGAHSSCNNSWNANVMHVATETTACMRTHQGIETLLGVLL